MELADLQGTHLELVNPESTPHCRSQDFTCTHATALDLTWITKPLEGPNSGRDMYHYFPWDTTGKTGPTNFLQYFK
jgi:hypothetical protein